MSDEVMQDNMQHTMQDNKTPWNADLTDPMLRLRMASERLSLSLIHISEPTRPY